MYYKLFINDAILQMFTAPVQKWTRNFQFEWSLYLLALMTWRIIFLVYCKKKNKYQNKKTKKNKKKTKKTKQNKKNQNKTKQKKRKNKAKKESKEILYLQVFPSSPLTRVFVPRMFNQEN